MSVRTAASASLREGRRTVGSGRSRMSAGKVSPAGFLVAVSMTIAPFDRRRGSAGPRGGHPVASPAHSADPVWEIGVARDAAFQKRMSPYIPVVYREIVGRGRVPQRRHVP